MICTARPLHHQPFVSVLGFPSRSHPAALRGSRIASPAPPTFGCNKAAALHIQSQTTMSVTGSPSEGLQEWGAVKEPSAPPEVLKVWRNAQAVCFDVDSTLCEDESIDEVAAFLGKGDEVSALTSSAMGGTVKFEDSLRARLALMNPSTKVFEDFLASHPPRISPGIPELVKLLQKRGTDVFLVSGGFRIIIHPIADLLNVPRDHVYANTLLFQGDGSYTGFDASEFTSRSGGKLEAVKAIKAKYGYTPMVMVGDGATDLEARQPGGADAFIGYGGVVKRPNVAAGADWYVYSISSLIEALK